MKILDILGMGLRNLMRRKTRTILTVVGVVVGATAIIIMLSLGFGMEEQLERTISGLGDLTILDIREYDYIMNPEGGGEEAQNDLNEGLLERVRTWEGVEAVTPYMYEWQINMYAGRNYIQQYPNMVGIDASFIPYLKMTLAQGEFPEPGDSNFIIFGRRVLYRFRDSRREPRQKDWEAMNNPDFDKPPKVNVLREPLALQVLSWNNPAEERAPRFKRYNLEKVAILEYVENEWGWDVESHEYMVYVDYRVLTEIIKEV
jgi:hypothetical protein